MTQSPWCGELQCDILFPRHSESGTTLHAHHLSKLISLDTFLLRKEMGQIVKDSSPFRKNCSHPLMGFLDKARDFLVNLGCFRFTVLFAGRKTFMKKHRLTRTLITHQPQAIAHTIFRDHGSGNV